MEELAKTKMLIEGLAKNIAEAAPEAVNIVKATQALRTLEERVEILKQIKNPPFVKDSDKLLNFDIQGTTRSLEVNIDQLADAVTIITEDEAQEEEKQESQYKEIDASKDENEFLERKLKNFEVVTSKTGALEKKCMLGLMKIVGELAEMRSKDLIEKN